jgi:hypothetical protein
LLAHKAGKILGVSWSDLPLLTDIGKLAFAALAAGGTAMLIRDWIQDMAPFVVLLTCGVVFGGAYAVVVLLLGVLTPDERSVVRRSVAAPLMRMSPQIVDGRRPDRIRRR